VLSRHLKYL